MPEVLGELFKLYKPQHAPCITGNAQIKLQLLYDVFRNHRIEFQRPDADGHEKFAQYYTVLHLTWDQRKAFARIVDEVEKGAAFEDKKKDFTAQ